MISTSNFQQGPNNPIHTTTTTIIILWVLNNPVDYWSVQSHKDLQRLQGHLIYSVLLSLKFPVAFWPQSSAHILALHPNNVNKSSGGHTLSLWALLSFWVYKSLLVIKSPKHWRKEFGSKCARVCVHWGWGNNWHAMEDMVNVGRSPTRGCQYGWRCSKLIMGLVEHKTSSTPKSKMTSHNNLDEF